jgi:hypothetical protein
MPDRRSFPEPPQDQSPKDHPDNPPRKIAPHTGAPDTPGTTVGEFTGDADPGVEKK